MKKLAALALLLLAGSCSESERVLRVCADPNNLPFSNRAGQGFENRIVELVAAELGARVHYLWWAQRRGNVRETLNAGLCDLIPGVGADMEMLATTEPYYHSTYVAVTRADLGPGIASFDDPRLRDMRIGVQMIGDDFSNTPPAHALASRGLIDNIRGYMVYGDYARPAPQREIVDAVARGEIDVAFVWGPVAGWFVPRLNVPLQLTPLPARDEHAGMPMAFAVAMGLRRGDAELGADLDRVVAERRPEISRILADYGVPTVPRAPAAPDDD